jgi:hypothetical protein
MDEQTCGKGLAAHAEIPAKLAALIDGTAANLEAHIPSLDTSDEASAAELEVYERLAAQHRAIAERLRGTSAEMADARDLPMGRHDPEKLASPEAVDAFRRLVAIEEDVVAALTAALEQHRAMLDAQAA